MLSCFDPDILVRKKVNIISLYQSICKAEVGKIDEPTNSTALDDVRHSCAVHIYMYDVICTVITYGYDYQEII